MGKRNDRALETFGFEAGRRLARKYEIVSFLGAGWEGEVYKVRERNTGIERAAKFFFPQRNRHDRATKFYARKLNKLRHCPIVIQYHTQETFWYHGMRITFLVSEYVEGELLSRFLSRQPGERLTPFAGLHLLYALALGVERIHRQREYHGDLHADNVIVRQQGIGFQVKLVDMYHWGSPSAENIGNDVCDLVRLFYDAIGGQKHYAKQAPEIRGICCGLKRSLILRKFRTAGHLREHLETMHWHIG